MFSETSYLVWRSMAFKPNDKSYGHIHGIVCSNDLILCTRVHIGMGNNVAPGSFHFRWMKKPFSIFRVPQRRFFVKDLPNNCCKIGPNHFSKILAHIYCTIDQMVGCKKIWSTSREKGKFPPIQVEAGQIWTPTAHSLLFIFSKNHF